MTIPETKNAIREVERFIHDDLGHAGSNGKSVDSLSRQAHAKIAALNADLVEAEAILAASAEAGQE